MERLAARRAILIPTTEVDVFLATYGWWPWLLLYAVIIGVIGAGLVYFLRRRRADKATAVASSTAQATPAAPPSETSTPPTDTPDQDV